MTLNGKLCLIPRSIVDASNNEQHTDMKNCNPNDWRLCKVNGDKWNGIIHLPTWTFFKIEAGVAIMIRTSEREPPTEQEIGGLMQAAIELFNSGCASSRPSRRQCSHGRGLVM